MNAAQEERINTAYDAYVVWRNETSRNMTYLSFTVWLEMYGLHYVGNTYLLAAMSEMACVETYHTEHDSQIMSKQPISNHTNVCDRCGRQALFFFFYRGAQ